MASLVLPGGPTVAGLPVGLECDSLPGTDRRFLGPGAVTGAHNRADFSSENLRIL